jgi:hypothetical protein
LHPILQTGEATPLVVLGSRSHENANLWPNVPAGLHALQLNRRYTLHKRAARARCNRSPEEPLRCAPDFKTARRAGFCRRSAAPRVRAPSLTIHAGAARCTGLQAAAFTVALTCTVVWPTQVSVCPTRVSFVRAAPLGVWATSAHMCGPPIGPALATPRRFGWATQLCVPYTCLLCAGCTSWCVGHIRPHVWATHWSGVGDTAPIRVGYTIVCVLHRPPLCGRHLMVCGPRPGACVRYTCVPREACLTGMHVARI